MSALVDSLNHPLAGEIRNLLSRATRPTGSILIDDEENILQARKAGVAVRAIFMVSGLSPAFAAALPQGVPVHTVAPRTCKKLFGADRVSRVFAIADTPQSLSLSAFAARAADIVVLDGLSITGNIGAIVRTSVALGVQGIIVLGLPYADVFDRRIIRSSRGHVFGIPVVASSRDDLVPFAKEYGYTTLACSAVAERAIEQSPALAHKRLAVIFGSEKQGCDPALAAQADFQARIPMNGAVESLNVSAAASIILYQRRLHQLGASPLP